MSHTKKSNSEFSEIEAKKAIRKLTIQNNKLSREVDALKEEINVLQGKGEKIIGASKYRSSFQKRSDNEYMYSKKSYPSYIWAHLRHNSLFNIYRRILKYIRKYTFVATTLKVISVLFVFVEAMLVIVISTSAFVASLLFTLLMTQTLLILDLFSRKNQNKKNRELIAGKNILILFPPKERIFEGNSYFKFMVSDYIKNDNSIAVIVSPYFVSSKGVFTPRRFYTSARMDSENVLIIRKSYYFSLRKKIIDDVASSVTEIY